MTSISATTLTFFTCLTLTSQAATCFNSQGHHMGLTSVWQERDSTSNHWISSHQQNRSNTSISCTMAAREAVLHSQMSRGIGTSPFSLCLLTPIIQESSFTWQEASMADEGPTLVPGGYPLLPPTNYPPTITAPTFTEDFQEGDSPNILNLSQNIITQESLGVVPEPSSGMLGAISLILLWRRKTP